MWELLSYPSSPPLSAVIASSLLAMTALQVPEVRRLSRPHRGQGPLPQCGRDLFSAARGGGTQ